MSDISDIRVLPKEVAELIAAGEVVERPASVIKELVENSIDAKASIITVEINRGGKTYMRVTDNGCGIPADQVRTAFLRHATSKVKTADDLEEIFTLGFRGEALASISAVSRVEILTAVKGAELGIGYKIEAGEEVSFDEIGCPVGTTIVIKDLFYNVPARMKFLKKDISEANTVAAIVERIALSHPEVSVKLIRDGKTVINTPGDGKLISTIYSVLGRDFASSLIPINYSDQIVSVSGYTCLPSRCRPNRNGQFFYLNGRYIKSGTISAALDQAYKNSAMVGKFPAGIISLKITPKAVDVNVHPTKTEVRFSDERRIFDAVYRAVKYSISNKDVRPELNIAKNKAMNKFAADNGYMQLKADIMHDLPLEGEKKPEGEKQFSSNGSYFNSRTAETKGNQSYKFNDSPFLHVEVSKKTYDLGKEIYRQNQSNESGDSGKSNLTSEQKTGFEKTYDRKENVLKEENLGSAQNTKTPNKKSDTEKPYDIENPYNTKSNGVGEANVFNPNISSETGIDTSNIKYIGEVFLTYILVQVSDVIYFIDKHAAHERINFERLKSELEVQSQMLFMPVSVSLLPEEYSAIISEEKMLEKYGFITEDFGEDTVIVRAIPAILSNEDVPSLISEIAGNLIEKGIPEAEKIDSILHSIACKSAIKAGYITSEKEQLSIAVSVLSSKKLMYCPHGRPIAFSLKKSQLEKQFGRLGD